MQEVPGDAESETLSGGLAQSSGWSRAPVNAELKRFTKILVSFLDIHQTRVSWTLLGIQLSVIPTELCGIRSLAV